MRNKVAKIVNASTGLMECKICGQRWSPLIKPDSNGRFYKGSQGCPNGCRISDSKESK